MKLAVDIIIAILAAVAWDLLCDTAGIAKNTSPELAVRLIPTVAFGLYMGAHGFNASGRY